MASHKFAAAVRRKFMLWRNSKPNMLAFIIGGLLLFVVGFFVPIIMLFFLGSVSMVYKHKFRGLPIGFELITLTTVIAGRAYGPFVGAVFGFVTAFSALMVASDYDAGAIFFFVACAVVGVLSAALPFTMPLLLVLMLLFVDMCTQWIPLLGAPEQRFVALVYMVMHMALSLAAYKLLGPLFQVMGFH